MYELLLQFNKVQDGSHLERIAVAFALTRCKLSLLYRSDSTTDFGLPDMMARRIYMYNFFNKLGNNYKFLPFAIFKGWGGGSILGKNHQ